VMAPDTFHAVADLLSQLAKAQCQGIAACHCLGDLEAEGAAKVHAVQQQRLVALKDVLQLKRRWPGTLSSGGGAPITVTPALHGDLARASGCTGRGNKGRGQRRRRTCSIFVGGCDAVQVTHQRVCGRACHSALMRRKVKAEGGLHDAIMGRWALRGRLWHSTRGGHGAVLVPQVPHPPALLVLLLPCRSGHDSCNCHPQDTLGAPGGRAEHIDHSGPLPHVCCRNRCCRRGW
jgi:hypothetical protein